MKVRFKKDALMNAVNIVIKAVSTKTTMPILECILLTAHKDGIYLTANDLELGIETRIDLSKLEVLEEGTVAVEARLFSDIIRKVSSSDDSDILLESDGNILEITSENTFFKIQERDAEQFPDFPAISEDSHIALSQFTLKEIIRQTIFSLSPNDSNKMMTGELFEVNGSSLRVVSLDGHRISVRTIELRQDFGNTKAIIPGKTLNEISKILTGEADLDVDIRFDRNYIMFCFDDTTMVSRLIDGEYFRIDAMLSNDYETKVELNRREFLEHIDRSTILVRETDKKPLVLNIKDAEMNLRLNSSWASFDSSLPASKMGKDLMIAFNPKFLTDALRVIDDESITLYMTTSKSPCFIKDEEKKYIYLILPVNFNPASY